MEKIITMLVILQSVAIVMLSAWILLGEKELRKFIERTDEKLGRL